MSRQEKQQGPIGWLIAAYRADPVRVIVYAITMLLIWLVFSLIMP